ncbi:MAG TPA: hypothetical protein VFL97_10825, partial [Nitrococcus sp.]|nr:hypothetical protein [Nitrococcus sp.]
PAELKDVDKLLEGLPEAPEERQSAWESFDDEPFVGEAIAEEGNPERQEPMIGALPDPSLPDPIMPEAAPMPSAVAIDRFHNGAAAPIEPIERETKRDIRAAVSERMFVPEVKPDLDQRIVAAAGGGGIDIASARRRKGRLLVGLVGLLLLATIIIFAGSQLHLSSRESGNGVSSSVLGFGAGAEGKRDFAITRATIREKGVNEQPTVDHAVN